MSRSAIVLASSLALALIFEPAAPCACSTKEDEETKDARDDFYDYVKPGYDALNDTLGAPGALSDAADALDFVEAAKDSMDALGDGDFSADAHKKMADYLKKKAVDYVSAGAKIGNRVAPVLDYSVQVLDLNAKYASEVGKAAQGFVEHYNSSLRGAAPKSLNPNHSKSLNNKNPNSRSVGGQIARSGVQGL